MDGAVEKMEFGGNEMRVLGNGTHGFAASFGYVFQMFNKRNTF